MSEHSTGKTLLQSIMSFERTGSVKVSNTQTTKILILL